MSARGAGTCRAHTGVAGIVDAANHYYELDDAFTRYIDRRFADTAVHIRRGDDGVGRPFSGNDSLYRLDRTPLERVAKPGSYRKDKNARYEDHVSKPEFGRQQTLCSTGSGPLKAESADAVYNRQRFVSVHLIHGCREAVDRIGPAQRLDGMWRSLAAHLLWEQGVGSSNLPIPTQEREAVLRGRKRPVRAHALRSR
jgi:hypothetical protein